MEERLGGGQEVAVQGEGSGGAGGDFEYVTTGLGHGVKWQQGARDNSLCSSVYN